MAEHQHGVMKSSSNATQDWDRVREAIVQRWPMINQTELRTCDCNAESLIDFVQRRANADRDEVESLVREYAPSDSKLESLKQTASQQYDRAAGAVGDAYQRTERQIQQHPAEATTVAFVSGLIIGAVTATLYFHSRPQPSVWQSMRDNYRRN